jgi:hypothetical protein
VHRLISPELREHLGQELANRVSFLFLWSEELFGEVGFSPFYYEVGLDEFYLTWEAGDDYAEAIVYSYEDTEWYGISGTGTGTAWAIDCDPYVVPELVLRKLSELYDARA